MATYNKQGTGSGFMSSFSEQKMHLLGEWRGDVQFLKTYFLSTLVVKYFMSQSVERLKGAACKEVFTPLWLMRGYFPGCCPICCNPIIPSPLYSGAAVSTACLIQPPPAKDPKWAHQPNKRATDLHQHNTKLFLYLLVLELEWHFPLAISSLFAYTSMMPIWRGVICHYLKSLSELNWMSQSEPW